MIECPKCGGKTKIVSSMSTEKSNGQYRRRMCAKCGARFSTVERILEGSFTDSKKSKEAPITLEEVEDLYRKFGLM